ncbi:MAG: LysR family transcriptional regulator substrate-binding protein [Nocardioidaceae bacterium]|nr:LysR family transcriptional regulator substrate-binding protein [Nocardioidaceae bacterium]
MAVDGGSAPRLLTAFRSAYPSVDVAINEIVSDGMLETVGTGTPDLAMAVQRVHVNMSGLDCEALITGPYDLAVASTHSLAQRRHVRLSELAEEPFVLHRPGSAVRDQILQACAEAGFAPRIALETREMSAARTSVAAGPQLPGLHRRQQTPAGLTYDSASTGTRAVLAACPTRTSPPRWPHDHGARPFCRQLAARGGGWLSRAVAPGPSRRSHRHRGPARVNRGLGAEPAGWVLARQR